MIVLLTTPAPHLLALLLLLTANLERDLVLRTARRIVAAATLGPKCIRAAGRETHQAG